jgi:hypothetical protein
MKTIILLIGFLTCLSSAYADMRGITLELSRTTHGETVVSMTSTVKEEDQVNMSPRDAATVLRNAKHLKDAIFVIMHSEDAIPVTDLLPLFAAMSDNDIGISYMQIGRNPTGSTPGWKGFPLPPPESSALGFSRLSPIPDVDPSVRTQWFVKVPTKLLLARTTNTLSVAIDRSSFEPTNIMVGEKMVTGVRSEVFVYPEGSAKPSQAGSFGLTSALDFNLGTSYLNAKEGIPVPGKKYLVELDLSIFETDIPSQHMWSPQSKNYRVLWKRTLRGTN